MKKLLKFERIEFIGKTAIVKVFLTHSNDLLGTIHWRSGWRCYVISYNNNIDMSLSCNKELNDFMGNLEEERKAKAKNENK